jgi:hypothetical protein
MRRFLQSDLCYNVTENLTWEKVLSSNYCKPGLHIDTFFKEAVLPSGYPYFAWNGAILKVVQKLGYVMTNKFVSDIK